MQQHLLLGPELFAYTKASAARLDALVKHPPPELRVLVSEACQHDRVTAQCEDIGTRQIPAKLKQLFPRTAVEIVFSLGRDDGLQAGAYGLAVHCGGCVTAAQHMRARFRGFRARGVPAVSYGQFLAYAAGGLARVRAVEAAWE